MPKIIVASQNPVKIESVRQGYLELFGSSGGQEVAKEDIEVTGVSVPSGVPDQPMGDAETLLGAKNRVKNAIAEHPGADFYVGIEGGGQDTEDGMMEFAWVCVAGGNPEFKFSQARSASFFIPEKLASLIRQGKELGEAVDIVFGVENAKQKTGAVGLLTGDVITRTTLYVPAVVLALTPFKNAKLYFG